SWYPLERLWEMLELIYDRVLGRDPAKALELGRKYGAEVWSSTHRLYIRDDPRDTLVTLPRSWPAYFNFGRLEARVAGDNAVELAVHELPDMPEVHGMTLAGWH